ncbi:MAG TPA: phosphoribosylformylglycinamidine cyclo-ligase, partial [Dehalococcoidia bacterium]|nr:phosphoribosylformylglycinamidine cyclo-ligase [Dehalococcoidia bacterium]
MPKTSESQNAPHYAEAGVDIGANDRLIPRYKALAGQATRPEVMGGVGPFSGLFDLSAYNEPVLVASTDGVGTKVLIARMMGRFGTVGHDLVNHCVDDILTAGAQPLFFLDYLANSGLTEDEKVEIVQGVATACRETGTALLGGETADMPDVYRDGDFDLAGTIVGIVEKGRQITGEHIRPGDILLGLPSTGLHTNGYSLVRSIFDLHGSDPVREAGVLQDA